MTGTISANECCGNGEKCNYFSAHEDAVYELGTW
jgi:hypothetical protein